MTPSKWTAAQVYEHNQRVASKARGVSPSAKSEPAVCNEPVAAKAREARDPATVRHHLVAITSFRRRLLDFDNLAGGCKYFLDCCKYANLIPDDNPQAITLQVHQVKVKDKAQERTEIEIKPLP